MAAFDRELKVNMKIFQKTLSLWYC